VGEEGEVIRFFYSESTKGGKARRGKKIFFPGGGAGFFFISASHLTSYFKLFIYLSSFIDRIRAGKGEKKEEKKEKRTYGKQGGGPATAWPSGEFLFTVRFPSQDGHIVKGMEKRGKKSVAGRREKKERGDGKKKGRGLVAYRILFAFFNPACAQSIPILYRSRKKEGGGGGGGKKGYLSRNRGEKKKGKGGRKREIVVRVRHRYAKKLFVNLDPAQKEGGERREKKKLAFVGKGEAEGAKDPFRREKLKVLVPVKRT